MRSRIELEKNEGRKFLENFDKELEDLNLDVDNQIY